MSGKEEKAITKYDYGQQAGKGFENTSKEDFSIPFLIILQAQSPQVIDGDAQIKDAAAGSLYNTVTSDVFAGKNGIVLVPCVTEHVFVEWVARDAGGGFVAVHTLDSDIVAKAKAASETFGQYKHGENDLVETFYIYGMRLNDVDDTEMAEPLVIAFTSTKIKKYKAIMSKIRTMKGDAPLFAHRLSIQTIMEKNTKGTFANFSIAPAKEDLITSLIPPKLDDKPHPLLVTGEQLSKDILAGKAKADHDSQDKSDDKEDVPF